MLHAAIGYVLELCALIVLPQLPSKVCSIDFSDRMHLFKNKEPQCIYIRTWKENKYHILFSCAPN